MNQSMHKELDRLGDDETTKFVNQLVELLKSNRKTISELQKKVLELEGKIAIANHEASIMSKVRGLFTDE
jgi:hypothetical protein